MKHLAWRQVVALSVAGLVLLLATAGALAVTGDLTQPAGIAGCVSETGAGPCADGHGLDNANAVAVSPDGKSVYVASGYSEAIARFNRNPTTGAITEPVGNAGCVSAILGPCVGGYGLHTPAGVAVSPDGKSVYVASFDSNAVARFNRNPSTGALTQPAGSAGCMGETGTLPPEPCAHGHGLLAPTSVAVSPDGRSVYVASEASKAVARLNRNPTTGAITQPAGSAGCVSETGVGPCADGHGLLGPRSVTVSPDGKSVYVASFYSGAVARLDRNPTTGAITQPDKEAGCVSETGAGECADGHGLSTPDGVAVSPDGKSVYVASFYSNAVVRLKRKRGSGAIKQPKKAGCVSETGVGPCADGHGLFAPASVAVSPDGKSVYIASADSSAVVRFDRKRGSGAITQPDGTLGCISEYATAPCADGHALGSPTGVAVSPDGQSVYAASSSSDAVVRFNRAP